MGDGIIYVYLIKNLINGKNYIGITNNFKIRMSNHKSGTEQVIDKAIHKYGRDNFLYKILEENLSIDKAKQKEKEYIIIYNSLIPNGYNVSPGGDYYPRVKVDFSGVNNGNASFTEEEVRFIKNHRDCPAMYLFYCFTKEYNEDTNYETFLNVYNDKTYKNIKPTVDKYPNNQNFGVMMATTQFSIAEIIKLREQYANIVYWKDAYEPYKNQIRWDSFWQIYNGYGAKGRLIMPYVFTEDNKKKHTKLKGQKYMSGEKNPKAKLTSEDVLEIRKMYEENQDFIPIYEKYPQVTKTTVRDICHRKTWKNI